jgi:hypothetical protein
MLASDKYAYVNIGNEGIVHLVRIKKDTPMPESDKAKLTDWANKMGFTISKRKPILRAE